MRFIFRSRADRRRLIAAAQPHLGRLLTATAAMFAVLVLAAVASQYVSQLFVVAPVAGIVWLVYISVVMTKEMRPRWLRLAVVVLTVACGGGVVLWLDDLSRHLPSRSWTEPPGRCRSGAVASTVDDTPTTDHGSRPTVSPMVSAPSVR